MTEAGPARYERNPLTMVVEQRPRPRTVATKASRPAARTTPVVATPERRSRLVVLAGPTAVNKDTVPPGCAAATRVWISVSATRPHAGGGEQGSTAGSSPTGTGWSDAASWSGRSSHRPPGTGRPGSRSTLALASGQPACSRSTCRAPAESHDDAGRCSYYLKPRSWEDWSAASSAAGPSRRNGSAAWRPREGLAAEASSTETIVDTGVHDAAERLVALMAIPTDL